MTTSTTHNNT